MYRKKQDRAKGWEHDLQKRYEWLEEEKTGGRRNSELGLAHDKLWNQNSEVHFILEKPPLVGL